MENAPENAPYSPYSGPAPPDGIANRHTFAHQTMSAQQQTTQPQTPPRILPEPIPLEGIDRPASVTGSEETQWASLVDSLWNGGVCNQTGAFKTVLLAGREPGEENISFDATAFFISSASGDRRLILALIGILESNPPPPPLYFSKELLGALSGPVYDLAKGDIAPGYSSRLKEAVALWNQAKRPRRTD